MSHKPPVPSASVSPYPLHPAPIKHEAPVTARKDGEPSGNEPSKKAIVGAAIGIGSAAIVAALLYMKRR